MWHQNEPSSSHEKQTPITISDLLVTTRDSDRRSNQTELVKRGLHVVGGHPHALSTIRKDFRKRHLG